MTDTIQLTIAIVIAALAGTLCEVIFLNHEATHVARAHCRAHGYSLDALVADEITRFAIHTLSLADYRKLSRVGSSYRLNRKARTAIWALVATRVELRKRDYAIPAA